MKVYSGQLNHVTTNNVALKASPYRYQPDGPLEWGKNAKGGGILLAASLLFDAVGSKMHAHAFALEVVSKLPSQWQMTDDWIKKWAEPRSQILRSVQAQTPKDFFVRA